MAHKDINPERSEVSGRKMKRRTYIPFQNGKIHCLLLLAHLFGSFIWGVKECYGYSVAYTYDEAVADYKSHNYKKAIAGLDFILKENPSHPGALFIRANIYLAQGMYSKALTDVNKSLEINPDSGILYKMRGVVYHALKDEVASIRDLERAYHLDPADLSIVSTLGACYCILADAERCQEFIKKLKASNDRKYRADAKKLEKILKKASPLPQKGAPQAQIVEYGVYKIKDWGKPRETADVPGGTTWDGGDFDLAQTTDKVPMQKDIVFGITVRLSGYADSQQVDFECRLSYPPIHKPDGSVSTGFTEPRKLPCLHGICYDSSQYALNHDYEMVSGTWMFEYLYKGKVVVSKEFTVYKE